MPCENHDADADEGADDCEMCELGDTIQALREDRAAWERRWEGLRQWVNDSAIPLLSDIGVLTKMLDIESSEPMPSVTPEKSKT